ncbi:heme/hemin ABC transporter substrate-binding protein [Terrarubrum flagellatum]|uniref:heme/hemin ABC transporter substrate-binding protein n=1 Tax=Terrirubrum flagellatum TaxID=2895980 RepID=UPI003144FCF6
MRRPSPTLSFLASIALTCAGVAGLFAEPPRFIGAREANAQTPVHQRIVAAGGVITEIIYALGMQDQIVGVDTTSLFPANAMKDKPNVGYVRALSAEGVLSLKPSLVIAIDGAGPPDALKLVTDAGVNVAHVPDEFTADGVVDRVRRVAAIVGAGPRGETLAASTAEGFRALDVAKARIATPKRVLFILSLQNGKVMAAGRNTSADAIMKLAGATNVFNAFDGYKPVTDEAITAAAPDFILAMDRAGQTFSADQIFALPSFATTPAAKTKSFAAMDGLYLLGFGPRTPDAARDLMQAIYGAAVAGRS